MLFLVADSRSLVRCVASFAPHNTTPECLQLLAHDCYETQAEPFEESHWGIPCLLVVVRIFAVDQVLKTSSSLNHFHKHTRVYGCNHSPKH